MIYNILQIGIKNALKKIGITDPIDFTLEHPQDLSFGDYSTNVALIAGKMRKENPRTLAEKIVSVLEKPKEVETIEIAGGGFINFRLSRDFFSDAIKKIDKEFGKRNIGEGRNILVEFSSPNIAKPFTIGHLRSTIIGDSLARILYFLGYNVIRDNHLGDWGTQFGKLIVAIKKWGDIDAIWKDAFPVKRLVELYVRFHDESEKNPALPEEGRMEFVKLEKGDAEARELWRKCIKWSLKEFEMLYEKLGVKFDTMLGESFFEDKMTAVLSELTKRGIAKRSEGALAVLFPSDAYPPFLVQKSDGSTLYSTRDLATDQYRLKTYGNDVTIINEVGIEQNLYFKQLFETERMLGWVKEGQRVHVGHGLYRFKDGKMSTRKGNVIWLQDIIDEAVKRAEKINPETATVVGIGAIKFNDLKRESKQDIVFNWDEVLNLKGDSGPYLQYSYVRAKSILKKAEEEKIPHLEEKPPSGGEANLLERLLYRFPEIVERAGTKYQPNYIATYLIDIAGAFNNFYAKEQIVSKDDDGSSYKVALTEAFSHVMKNGLWLLGIETPERM